jgi:hypothetical protein
VVGIQVNVTEWVDVWVPSPEREIVTGESVALLSTTTLPGKLPAASGENVASNVADCPGARIRPAETPVIEYRAPVILTFDIVTSEFPAFVRVRLDSPLFPMVTFPKFKLVLFVVSSAFAANAVPLKETVLGELERLLIIEITPDSAPAAFGEKMALNVACLPG